MTGKRKKNKKADKNKPKRPMTAYNFFFKDEHERIRAELEAKDAVESEKEGKAETELTKADGRETPPAKRRKKISPREVIGLKELGKLIGQRWKEVSEEDLEEYKEMSRKDTERYKEESEQYYREQVNSFNTDPHEGAAVVSDLASSNVSARASGYNTSASPLSAHSSSFGAATLDPSSLVSALAAGMSSNLISGVPISNTVNIQQLLLQQYAMQQAGLTAATVGGIGESTGVQQYQSNSNTGMNALGAPSFSASAIGALQAPFTQGPSMQGTGLDQITLSNRLQEQFPAQFLQQQQQQQQQQASGLVPPVQYQQEVQDQLQQVQQLQLQLQLQQQLQQSMASTCMQRPSIATNQQSSNPQLAQMEQAQLEQMQQMLLLQQQPSAMAAGLNLNSYYGQGQGNDARGNSSGNYDNRM